MRDVGRSRADTSLAHVAALNTGRGGWAQCASALSGLEMKGLGYGAICWTRSRLRLGKATCGCGRRAREWRAGGRALGANVYALLAVLDTLLKAPAKAPAALRATAPATRA